MVPEAAVVACGEAAGSDEAQVVAEAGSGGGAASEATGGAAEEVFWAEQLPGQAWGLAWGRTHRVCVQERGQA